MEKRAAMAMGLIFLLWMVYFALYAPKTRPRPTEITFPEESVEVSGAGQEKAPRETPFGDTIREDEGLLSAVTQADSAGMPEAAMLVDTVVVTSDLYQFHFITRGGVLVRAYLKDYPSFGAGDRVDTGETPSVQLIPTRNSQFLASRLFFKNHRYNRMDSVDLASLTFEASTYRLTLDSLREEGSITFTRNLQGGRELKLVYIFRNDSYKIDINLSLPSELRISEENLLEVTLGPTLVSNEKDPKKDYENYYEIVYGEEGGVK